MVGRPAPTVLLWRTLGDDNTIIEEVCAGQGGAVYAVCLDGAPVGIRKRDLYDNRGTSKYSRTTFVNAGQAHRLCRGLNAEYKCDRFTVKAVIP